MLRRGELAGQTKNKIYIYIYIYICYRIVFYITGFVSFPVLCAFVNWYATCLKLLVAVTFSRIVFLSVHCQIRVPRFWTAASPVSKLRLIPRTPQGFILHKGLITQYENINPSLVDPGNDRLRQGPTHKNKKYMVEETCLCNFWFFLRASFCCFCHSRKLSMWVPLFAKTVLPMPTLVQRKTRDMHNQGSHMFYMLQSSRSPNVPHTQKQEARNCIDAKMITPAINSNEFVITYCPNKATYTTHIRRRPSSQVLLVC